MEKKFTFEVCRIVVELNSIVVDSTLVNLFVEPIPERNVRNTFEIHFHYWVNTLNNKSIGLLRWHEVHKKKSNESERMRREKNFLSDDVDKWEEFILGCRWRWTRREGKSIETIILIFFSLKKKAKEIALKQREREKFFSFFISRSSVEILEHHQGHSIKGYARVRLSINWCTLD